MIVDPFTSYAEAYHTRNKGGKTIADKLYNGFILCFAFPTKVNHNQIRGFKNQLFLRLEELSGIQHFHTTPYHPQGNWQVVWFNRTLLDMLQTLSDNEIHSSSSSKWLQNIRGWRDVRSCNEFFPQKHRFQFWYQAQELWQRMLWITTSCKPLYWQQQPTTVINTPSKMAQIGQLSHQKCLYISGTRQQPDQLMYYWPGQLGPGNLFQVLAIPTDAYTWCTSSFYLPHHSCLDHPWPIYHLPVWTVRDALPRQLELPFLLLN